MEIIYLEFLDYKMYNAKTGEVIMDESCDDTSESLKGLWVDTVFDVPIIKDEKLLEKWNQFLEIFDNGDYDFEDFTIFLDEYDDDDLIVYEICNGIAYGSDSSTAWFVVDKDVVVEEII